MSGLRGDKKAKHGTKAARDAASLGELLSSRVRARPGAGFLDAGEAAGAGSLADEERSRKAYALKSFDASLAAFHSYRAVYGNSFGSHTEPLMDALRGFWLDRFREGCPAPFGFSPTAYQEAPAAREDTAPSPSPSKAVETDGR